MALSCASSWMAGTSKEGEDEDEDMAIVMQCDLYLCLYPDGEPRVCVCVCCMRILLVAAAAAVRRMDARMGCEGEGERERLLSGHTEDVMSPLSHPLCATVHPPLSSLLCRSLPLPVAVVVAVPPLRAWTRPTRSLALQSLTTT